VTTAPRSRLRSRSRPLRPIVGVGAVIIDEGRVLVVKRGHAPHKGEWSVPGGAVELGETLRDAVAREVREETGLDVDVGPVVDVVDRLERDADGAVVYHYVVVDYKCRPQGGRLAAGSDAEDARWVAADGLASLPLADVTMAVVRKALALNGP
jgi:ADP-ribose pyrophosphatase YjhB (NUDIX family)